MGFVQRNKACEIEYIKTKIDRCFLDIKITQNPTNKILVIMKNPSSTCFNCPNMNNTHNKITSYSDKKKCKIDRTTGRILRFLKQNNYDEIIILNLYSYYDSNPGNVNSYYYGGFMPSIFQKNNAFIKAYLKYYQGKIVCAWGGNNGIFKPNYDAQINLISSSFNNNHTLLEYDLKAHTLISRTNAKYPPHGLNWI